MRAKSKDSLTTFCTIEGCGKPRRARMLCVSHYNREHRKPNPTAEFTCPTCGVAFVRERARANRYERLFCSTNCRDKKRRAETRAVTVWTPRPTLHRFIDSAPRQPRYPSRAFVSGRCKRCGDTYIDRQVTALFCSRLCAKRWHRDEWKARTNRVVPKSVREYVYARDSGICQLCLGPVDMTLKAGHAQAPTLDHIVCQSWTLIPDHSPSNLRLAHMMCNASRGNEWTKIRLSA